MLIEKRTHLEQINSNLRFCMYTYALKKWAKNLNKLLSKIPVIGNIIIPKEIGEGLFGVSFKMKGMPGKIKTTINPIKTLTPRFITKALEKSKKSK